ncbi:MAG: MFS transporter [Proteobacteria bacterium]|nr:MFS transporter [Pseudomonadota bacterium]
MPDSTQPKSTWRFSGTFWFANSLELCERAAYYGFFVLITLYLSSVVGFSDITAGIIAGVFAGLLYLLPPFMGVISDRIGFRRAMLMAFALLSFGYGMLGVWHDKVTVCLFLFVLVIGSAFIKPLITGTVAKTTDETNRARGFSLFYWTVNIGAFLGKTFIPFVRQGIGIEYINYFSSAVCLVALFIAFLFYHPKEDEQSERKTFGELFHTLFKILTNARLLVLTLIIAGFWTVQQQLYASMPKYVIRTVGEDAKPEWIANVNPLVVVICVIFVTQWMRKKKAITSMTLGMFIMPFSAFAMSLGPWLRDGAGDSLLGLHPFTFMLVVGIALQGLAECFISPRFLEFFSLQAPKGEEGVYLGFSHLHSFFSTIAGFFISGFLLDKYCPDPKTLPENLTDAEIAATYANAHHIWYYFVVIAFVSGIALVIYSLVCRSIDQKKLLTADAKSDSEEGLSVEDIGQKDQTSDAKSDSKDLFEVK